MIVEIMKVIPQISRSDLTKMTTTLQTRFTRIARSFGRTLRNVVMRGGPIGLALGFLTKLINPLQKIQESMERTLQQSGDIVANAERFGTTEGKLFRLRSAMRAKGIGDDDFYMMLTRFQTGVAKARQDPESASYLRGWVDTEDMAEGFFNFIQAVQQMTDKAAQAVILEEVFSRRRVPKLSSLMTEKNLGGLLQEVAPRSIEDYSKRIRYADQFAETYDRARTRREGETYYQVAGRIRKSTIDAIEKSAQMTDDQEIKNMEAERVRALAAIDVTIKRIEHLIDDGLAEAVKGIQALVEGSKPTQALFSKWFKGHPTVTRSKDHQGATFSTTDKKGF